MKNSSKDYELVYSDDPAHMKKDKKNSSSSSSSSNEPLKSLVPRDINLKIRLERNGRGGKLVTVIFEIPGPMIIILAI